MESTKNQNIRIAIGVVVGIIIGVVGYKIWADSRTPTTNLTSDEQDYINALGQTASSSSANLVENDGYGLSVNDQAPGNRVVISQTVMRDLGWVVIHDDDNGQPGRILGAGLFNVGTSSGNVDLLRDTINGTKYIAVIQGNVGNYHYFNPDTDLPVKDAAGSMIMVTFTAGTPTAASSITATNTPATGLPDVDNTKG